MKGTVGSGRAVCKREAGVGIMRRDTWGWRAHRPSEAFAKPWQHGTVWARGFGWRWAVSLQMRGERVATRGPRVWRHKEERHWGGCVCWPTLGGHRFFLLLDSELGMVGFQSKTTKAQWPDTRVVLGRLRPTVVFCQTQRRVTVGGRVFVGPRWPDTCYLLFLVPKWGNDLVSSRTAKNCSGPTRRGGAPTGRW